MIMVTSQAVATLVALPTHHVVDDRSPTAAVEVGESSGKADREAIRVKQLGGSGTRLPRWIHLPRGICLPRWT